MFYGYMRVSTTGQLKGNSLEEQERLLRENGATVLYQDAFTGTKTSRPNFNKLLKVIKRGDTLIITKLDRFARNTVEGINVIQMLLERGVRVNILNMGMVDNTPTGKLILTVMLGFAEFERDMILQRTSEGRAIARTKKGYLEGRPPKYDEASVQTAYQLLQEHTYAEVSEITGMSKSTLQRLKKKCMQQEEDGDEPDQ